MSIYHKDCIEGLKEIESNSIDIIICDPPYNIGKDFGNDSDKQTHDEYLLWCDEWINQCIRILKSNGTLYIYGFSETLSFIRVRININVRWLIWHYTNKVSPSAKFWQRSHESILCCYKSKPIFNKDDIREPYTQGHINNIGKIRTCTKGRFSDGKQNTTYKGHPNGALPRDVIKISSLSGGTGMKERVNHPTQKPLELSKKLLKASMNKDGHTKLVVPFIGSGTECVAAKELGIDFIGFEINKDYIDIASKRLEEK